DKAQRKAIESEAAKKGWTSIELEERIRPINSLKEGNNEDAVERVPTAKPLAAKRGTVGVYRVVADAEMLSVDLGFTSFLDLTGEQSDGLKGGSLVRLDAKGKFLPADDAKASDLYTYRAEVIR